MTDKDKEKLLAEIGRRLDYLVWAIDHLDPQDGDRIVDTLRSIQYLVEKRERIEAGEELFDTDPGSEGDDPEPEREPVPVWKKPRTCGLCRIWEGIDHQHIYAPLQAPPTERVNEREGEDRT